MHAAILSMKARPGVQLAKVTIEAIMEVEAAGNSSENGTLFNGTEFNFPILSAHDLLT